MFPILRGLVATLVVCALFAVSAAPASAVALTESRSAEERSVNVLFDAVVLRPVGLLMTISGSLIYSVGVVPIVAITRPTDLGKPLEALVIRPARYTFVDPLGQH